MEEKKLPEETKEQERPARSGKATHILRIIAGGYLLYTTYSLAQGLLKGESSSPWIVVAAVVFAVFGALCLYSGLRGYTREEKLAREEEERRMEEEDRLEAEKSKVSSGSMSISQRANLARTLEEAKEEAEDINEE